MKKHYFLLLLTGCMLTSCGSIKTSTAGSAEWEIAAAQISELQEEYELLQEEIGTLKEQLAALNETPEQSAAPTETPPGLSGQNPEQKPAAKPASQPPNDSAEFNAEDVLSKLEVKEYGCTTSYGSFSLFLVVTNHSESTIALTADLTPKNQEGQLTDVVSDYIYAFEGGATICLSFSLDEQPASYEYDFFVSEEEWCAPILSNLSYETSVTGDKVIVSVTNNGDIPAEFVTYRALFFQGDTLVASDYGYTTDNDSELKPGKTIHSKARCRTEFDTVQIYLSGTGPEID